MMNDKLYSMLQRNKPSVHHGVSDGKEKADSVTTASPWLEYNASLLKYFSAFIFSTLLATLPLCGCTTTRLENRQQTLLYQRVDSSAHPVFREVVAEAIAADWAPVGTSLEPELAGSADYMLNFDFQVRKKELKDPEHVWRMTNVVLLTLYPSSCARYEMELTADLRNRSDQIIKSWRQIKQDTAFLWLFQGSDCLDVSDETVHDMATGMLKEFYRRMAEEIDLSAQAVAPIDHRPLVYVVSNDLDNLIQRVVKFDATNANFTFESQKSAPIDYTLRISFESVRHDQNFFSLLSRGVFSIWTIGLVSFCPVDETVLNAELQDADGKVLKRYRFTKSRRGSFTSQQACEPITYKSDRELAENLLLQLFHQVEQEKIIQKS